MRLRDGESGLSRTIQRRLATTSGLFGYLVRVDELAESTRRTRNRRASPVALARSPHTLPTILEPREVDALLLAMRRWRDRAMVEAMVLGCLRRCRMGRADFVSPVSA